MKDYMEERIKQLADYCIINGATVRTCATVFGVSKSTVHKDLTERLPKMDLKKAERVDEVLQHNKAVRAIRGGEATRIKYLALRKKKSTL